VSATKRCISFLNVDVKTGRVNLTAPSPYLLAEPSRTALRRNWGAVR
jgi:hypothetical protein